jgi:predicted PurR-regulated permease PerM
MLGGTLLDSVGSLARNLEGGSIAIPPPPAPVAAWPVIGGSVHKYWAMASENLQEALSHFQPQLVALSSWLVSFAAGTLRSVLEFTVAVLIAGVLLARSEQSAAAARAVASRLAGQRGLELADLAGATVRSVAQGVLGVALIQGLLAGLGFAAIGVPAAGLWALLVLFLAILQLPPLIVIGPIIVYAFYTSSTVAAVLFAIWGVAVSLSDTALKPLLLGRGLPVPMLIVLVGAIGGMLAAGIVGLFVGSVVLALGYQLLLAWLEAEPA